MCISAIFIPVYKNKLLHKIVNIRPLLLQELPGVLMHLQQLREFYDPDTVELMNWITYVTNIHM